MFKTMTGVLDLKKNPTEDEIDKIPSFIFCRWLGGNQNTIMAANQINLKYNIPMTCQYNMVKKVFGGKIRYIQYLKKSEEVDIKKIQMLSTHYNIGMDAAKEALELISPEQLQSITKMYKQLEEKRNG